jgi:hypothetical protein
MPEIVVAVGFWWQAVDPGTHRSSGCRRPDRQADAAREIAMSQYLILIHDDEGLIVDDTAARIMDGHNKFGENNGAAIVGGNALQARTTATTLRSDGAGTYTVTDGPFVETKEVLAGYYLIEAGDLDEAIAVARQIPTASPDAGLEIRPIMVFEGR